MPTGEDAAFSFLAQPSSAKTYTFGVRQTYSDGSVVDWSGPESSDTPAPTVEAKSLVRRRRAARRSRSSRSSSARSASCSASSRSSPAEGARWREAPRAIVLACRAAGGAGAAGRGVRARGAAARRFRRRACTLSAPPKQVALTYSEAVEPRFAIVSVTDAAGQQEAAGPPPRSPANPDTLARPAQAHARGLVPRLLARHLGRRPPGARGVHVRGRAECRAGAAVPGPVDLRDGSHAPPARRALGGLPRGDGRDRAARLPARDRPPGCPPRRRDSLRSVSIAFVVAAAVGLVAIPVYLRSRRRTSPCAPSSRSARSCRCSHVSAFGRGYLDLELCFALFVAAGAIALWVDRPDGAQRSIVELLAFAGAGSPLLRRS